MYFIKAPNPQDIQTLLTLPIYSLERLFSRLPCESKERLIRAMLEEKLT
ncbi:hypothetical protein [Vibrio inusitatus]|nr:hypothetical protein [Vibrio inusitatus]